MKLFKSLLVAPATLGLLAPLSANATEINLNEIATYSDAESIEFANSFNPEDSNHESLLAGGEGLVDSHDHGSDSFSSTTAASFGVDFLVGAVYKTGANEKVTFDYQMGICLETSFTG